MKAGGHTPEAFKPREAARRLRYHVVTIAGEQLDRNGFTSAAEALNFGWGTGVGGLWWVEARFGDKVDQEEIEKAILSLVDDGDND